MKRVLILGIGGMDGSHLADTILEAGCEVHGTTRRCSVDNLTRISHCRSSIHLHQADLLDSTSLLRILTETPFDEIYNEADQDHVGWSHATVGYSMSVTATAVGTLLELIRQVTPRTKVFQPVSAMMFGNAPAPQNETTPFSPQSPYAVAKTAAYYLCRFYRQTHGMFISTAIMYNHESPRRGPGYLMQKICRAAKKGIPVSLSDLDMEVDIGYAGDYMDAAYQLMQLDSPDDFIIGSSTSHRIGNIVEEAYKQAAMSSVLVLPDPSYKRTDGSTLRGNVGKAVKAFNYHPKVGMRQLITMLLKGI